MKLKPQTAVGLLLALCVGQLGASERLFVYPAAGQSDQQLADDRFACHRWAVAEAGFDPVALKPAAPPAVVRVPLPANRHQGATVKGALTGAVIGAVVGEIGGEPGHGAAAGAVLGTVAGAAKEAEGEAEARQAAEAQAQQLASAREERAVQRANYRRALTACLEGRQYTVR